MKFFSNPSKSLLLLYVIVSVFILSATTVQGQNDNEEFKGLLELSLEELMNIDITTATKTAGKMDLAPSVVEVITGDQIQQRGYQNMGQLLNDIADNHTDRSNWGIGEPLNQNVGFGFRFDTGQNMLILFNGQRLNAFLPGNRFGGEEYLLNNIERIEIIRGPGSAIYGTSAFTAVINIISKKVAEKKDELFKIGTDYIPTSKGLSFNSAIQTTVGKKGSLSGAFRYFAEAGQSLNVKNALFGDQTLKDGVNHAVDGEIVYSSGKFNLYSKLTNQQRKTFTGFNGVSPTALKELTVSMYAYSIGSDYTFTLSPKTNLKLSGGWHQDNWAEIALIPQFKLNSDGTRLMLDAGGSPILDTLTLYRDGNTIRTPFFIDGQGADTRSLDGEIQFTHNYRKQNNIVFGIYVADDRVLQATRPSELNPNPLEFVPFRIINDNGNNWLFDTKASRQTAAFYGQMDYNITDNLSITGGARADDYSGKGILQNQHYVEINPRGGVVYATENTGIFKLLYGKATRIPNGFETLSSVTILGNPENRPERIQTFQFQWIKNWNSNLRTEAGIFRATISNRLVTNADISDQLKAQGFIGQFVNLSSGTKQMNNGVDGKVNYRLNKVNLAVNFTKYLSSDDGTGHAIAYIPTSMINGDVNIPGRWLNINTGFNYRNQFTRAEGDTRQPIKGYLTARLNLVVTPTNCPLQFKLTGRNIFNTQYAYPSSSHDFYANFPARGIEIVLGMSYKFD